jgi:hypothetical protein
VGLKHLIDEFNFLIFDELPFPLALVTGKNVVKVQHY